MYSYRSFCQYHNALLLILNWVLLVHAQNAEEVDYYTNLVEDGIEEAVNYELPISANEYRPRNDEVQDFGAYDFVIIGSGASGSALAGRLAAISNFTVLVLEAGTFGNNFTDIPNMYYYDRGTRYNWGFFSTPQSTACLGMIDRRCPFPRGRGFGGTTLLNGLIYSRGNRRDYDRWRNDGNPGWDYKTVLKYFVRAENTSIDNADPGYHGRSGPLNVQHHSIESRQTKTFLAANNELGIPTVDYNGARQHGVSRIQTTIRDGQRLTSYRAFLEPQTWRRNLHLLPNSYVVRLTVNETSNRREVRFSRANRLYVVRANKEIVVSAGAINSPQILMLSGIGPREHLRQLDIPVVRDLPVGNNLHDHATYYGTYFVTNATDPLRSVRQYVAEYLNATGFYTVAANLQGIGYFETSSNREKGYPDAELVMVPSPILNNYTQTAFHFTDETYRGLWGDVDGARSFIVYIVLLRPESTGRVRLQSNDPYQYPAIDPRFLSDRNGRDIRKIYEMIRFVRRLQDTAAFRSIDAKVGPIDLPACRKHAKRADAKRYWYCNIRQLTMNLYHPVGTNKMGPSPSEGAVVDARFRVHGYKTLRVVDASVLPFSFAGHPVAAAMMVGDRAAEFIVEDHSS